MLSLAASMLKQKRCVVLYPQSLQSYCLALQVCQPLMYRITMFKNHLHFPRYNDLIQVEGIVQLEHDIHFLVNSSLKCLFSF